MIDGMLFGALVGIAILAVMLSASVAAEFYDNEEESND